MNCKNIKDLIPEYLNNSLDSAIKEKIEAHVKECPECQTEFETVKQMWNQLGSLETTEPSANMNSRFEAMLDGYVQGQKNSKPHPSLFEQWRIWWQKWQVPRPAFQLAIAVICFLAGFGIARLQQKSSPEFALLKQEVTEMREVLTISMLNQNSSLTRLSGINLSQQFQKPDPKIIAVLLQTIEIDPNVNVRLAAIDALARFKSNSQIGPAIIKGLPRQNSPLVQIAMINYLINQNNHNAVPIFRKLVKDSGLNPAVKSHLQWGIEQLI